MQKRRLGKTGLEVGQVGFGGIKLPQVSEAQAAEVLNAALDLGISFIDTARNYQDSERKIGKAIGHRRKEYHIATKSCGRDRSALRRDLEKSLSELGMDRIDLYQLHSVSDEGVWGQVTAKDGALAEARKAQAEGLVDHVGITIHRDLKVMKQAIECGEFETLMVCYSAIDAEHVGPEILPLAGAKGMGVIIMKSLSGGMLVSRGFEEGRRAGEEDPLVTQCLRYVLTNKNVSCVIPGMRNAAEVRQNVRVGKEFSPMSDAELGDLVRTLGSMGKAYRYGQVCLQCGYCQPCPEGVKAPEIFRAQMMAESYPDPLQRMGFEAYEALEIKADGCIQCRKCVGKCPAGLDVPEKLKEAREFFETAPRNAR
jgi:predicted aldo/keto reductase-like oxidoreductase